MPFREPGEANIITWLIIGAFSTWGGLVRYIMDTQNKQTKWSWMGIICQLIVSGFTGLTGGLLSFETGASSYMTFIIAGLFGTMGSTALSYLWQRIFPGKNLP